MAVKRLARTTLLNDIKTFAGLQGIGNYEAANANYTLEKIVAAHEEMLEKQRAETVQRGILDAARDAAADSEYRFHQMISGGKLQIIAQFGEDSDEIQKLGMKKKSEHRKRGRRVRTDEK